MAESKFTKRAIQALSVILILGAIALYIWWGIKWGSWNIFEPGYVPIYGFMVVMIVFGLCGLLLTRQKD